MLELKHFKEFQSKNDYDSYINGSPILPNVSFVGQDKEVYYKNGKYVPPAPINPYSSMYLTAEITSSGTMYFTSPIYDFDEMQIFYKLNDNEWIELTGETDTSISVEVGDKIQFKGYNFDNSSHEGSDGYQLFDYGTDCNFIIYGNIMSLVNGDDFVNLTTLTEKTKFNYIFENCETLVSAEHLVLPSTTLIEGCYEGMFVGCTSLVAAPELPATTLADNCYSNMFEGCSSLSSIKCLATDISATDCTLSWVQGVSENGTFTKASDADWSSKTGSNGIPSGWQVVEV